MNKLSGIIAVFASKNMREKMARGVIASFLGMFVMACGGCGGGGGSSNPAATAAAQPTPPKAVQVVFAGDSTSVGTEFIGGKYVQTGVARADLETALQSALGNSVTVSTNGMFGSTLEQMIAGTNGFPQSYSAFLASSPAKVVIENFALNEPFWDTPDQFKQALIQFVTLTQQAGKVPVLEEPNPNCIQNTQNDFAYPQGITVAPYVQAIRDVAQAYNIAIVHQYDQIKAMPNWCALMSDFYEHPGDQLYAIKAKNQAAVLIPIIQALQK